MTQPQGCQEKEMARIYEVMFIIRPDMPEDEVEKLIAHLEGSVTSSAGTVKVERMGKRRLATVRKFQEGIYVLLTVEGSGQMVHELERRMRVTEPVIKFLTVRVDEEQKRLEKVKKIRDSRVKRKPQPAAEVAGAEPAPAASV
jgi:small subunit ribosomal protein S6